MTLILNQSQAEAVYSAMCALNNVGMLLTARMSGCVVWEDVGGNVWVQATGISPELHSNQAAFAIAYGLQTG